MNSKTLGVAGLLVTVGAMIAGAAIAHGQMVERVAQTTDRVAAGERRIEVLEAKIDDVLWNVARMCEAQELDCRSGSR